MEIALSTYAELGVPVATEKVEGPLEILGIETEMVAMEIRHPGRKVSKLGGHEKLERSRRYNP